MIEHMNVVVWFLAGKRNDPVSKQGGSYPEPLCILLPSLATGKWSWFIPAEDLALGPGIEKKKNNNNNKESCFQLSWKSKVIVQEDSGASSHDSPSPGSPSPNII